MRDASFAHRFLSDSAITRRALYCGISKKHLAQCGALALSHCASAVVNDLPASVERPKLAGCCLTAIGGTRP
jgi:hypothetical protein